VIPYNNNNATHRYVGTAVVVAVQPDDPKGWFYKETISPANIGALHKFAALFEQWRFNYLAFSYVPAVSINQPGLVIISPTYCAAPKPSNQDEAFSTATNTISSVHLPSKEVNLSNVHRGVWFSAAKGNEQQPGCLLVSTIGAAKDITHGHITARYSIEFRNPL
jgi:hypothetical protein